MDNIFVTVFRERLVAPNGGAFVSLRPGKMGWVAVAAAVRFAMRQEEAETAVLRTLGVPGPDPPDITPTRHGTPSAGTGGHDMFMGDDREAGLGLGDQGCGASVAARQAPEKESFMAKERGDYRQDARMNNRSHVSGTPLSGGG